MTGIAYRVSMAFLRRLFVDWFPISSLSLTCCYCGSGRGGGRLFIKHFIAARVFLFPCLEQEEAQVVLEFIAKGISFQLEFSDDWISRKNSWLRKIASKIESLWHGMAGYKEMHMQYQRWSY